MKQDLVSWLNKNMKVLFIGDIVGAVGRETVSRQLPLLKQQYAIDLVIANGENAAHGKGITRRIYNQLLACGIDVITMGNHTFSKNDIYQFIDEAERMVRPANMEPLEYGEHTVVIKVQGKRVAITNLSGEVWMNNVIDSPFYCMEDILQEVEADIYLVDLHAEATSEKIVYGCAAITDLGMCGAYTSVLGRDVNEIVTRFTTQEKTKFKIAEGEGIFCGALVDIDDATNRAIGIKRIQIRPEHVEC